MIWFIILFYFILLCYFIMLFYFFIKLLLYYIIFILLHYFIIIIISLFILFICSPCDHKETFGENLLSSRTSACFQQATLFYSHSLEGGGKKLQKTWAFCYSQVCLQSGPKEYGQSQGWVFSCQVVSELTSLPAGVSVWRGWYMRLFSLCVVCVEAGELNMQHHRVCS